MKTRHPVPARFSQGRFLVLDALRGFAAIAVALFHYDRWLMPGGYLAVDFFFALSGFVLVNSYADRFAAGLTSWRFIRMRAVRLLPLHLVGICIGLTVAFQALVRHRPDQMGVGPFLSAAFLNPLMLPSPLSETLFPFNGPAWSLFFEMLANIAMALLLIRLRTQVLLIVIAIAAAVLFTSVWFMQDPKDPSAPANSAFIDGAYWTNCGIGLARTAFSFCLGMALAKLPRAETRTERFWAIPCCALLLIVLALPVGAQWRLAYDLAAVMLASPLLIYACSRFEPDRHFARVAGFVGEISFALYAIHFPVRNIFFFIEHKTHLSQTVLVPFFMAVSLALAWGAVRWFDLPARRFLARWVVG